jgi:2-haloacid dehalogenase
MAAGSKNAVFDIVGTCVSYDKVIDTLDKVMGDRMRAEGVKPSLFVYMWVEAGEREYTYLSITGRYIAYDKIFESIFYRMLWMSGIQEPRKFCTDAEVSEVVEGYFQLEMRPDTAACFDKLRAAGFTVRGLTAGALDRVAGYFKKAGIDMPAEHLMSCDSLGVGKPDLNAYRPTYEALKGGDELWFCAAHMWDVSSAKTIGFV